MFNIYIKPTELCNLKCDHCYIPLSSRENSFKMTPEQVDYILDQCLNFFSDLNKVNLIFHGGEPLLMGKGFYSYVYNNWKNFGLNFRIQTNLLLYDSSWSGIIEKVFCGKIGTSFDVTRKTNKGFNDFYKRWLEKYKEAKKSVSSMFLGICVSKPFLKKPINYWVDFIKSLSPSVLSFEYYLDVNRNNRLYIPYRRYLDFLIEFSEAWAQSGNPLNIREFMGLFGISYDFSKKEYFFKPNMHSRLISFCGDKNLVINPNGDVGICPAMTANKFKLGNIFQKSLSEIVQGECRVSFIAEHKLAQVECVTCKYSFCCEGHCIVLKQIGEQIDKDICESFLDRAKKIVYRVSGQVVAEEGVFNDS